MSALFGAPQEFRIQDTLFRIALVSVTRTDYGSVFQPQLQEYVDGDWVSRAEYQTIWSDVPEQMTSELYAKGMLRKFNEYIVTRFPPSTVTAEQPDLTEVSQAVFKFTNDVYNYCASTVYSVDTGEFQLG